MPGLSLQLPRTLSRLWMETGSRRPRGWPKSRLPLPSRQRTRRLLWSSPRPAAQLRYRLNVFPIEVPSLRERKDDIFMLVQYFVQRYAARMAKNISSIDKKTLDVLLSYEWPGNIRELQNVIERSVILSSGHCCPRRGKPVAWPAENTCLGGAPVGYWGGGLRFELSRPVQVIPEPGGVVRQPGSAVECLWGYPATESIRDR